MNILYAATVNPTGSRVTGLAFPVSGSGMYGCSTARNPVRSYSGINGALRITLGNRPTGPHLGRHHITHDIWKSSKSVPVYANQISVGVCYSRLLISHLSACSASITLLPT